MSTKEKILDAALTLFAENGYDGTSVEQIASIVGIKAPSLYKHYKGKEDILNALIDSAEARYEEMFGSEKNIGAAEPGRVHQGNFEKDFIHNKGSCNPKDKDAACPGTV